MGDTPRHTKKQRRKDSILYEAGDIQAAEDGRVVQGCIRALLGGGVKVMGKCQDKVFLFMFWQTRKAM